jgi:PTS system nitrogen regulatory IIA component
MEKWLSNRQPLLTTAAVAKWLGVATRTLCLWAECKEIPAIKIGGQWRFREDELRDWLQSPRAAKVNNMTNPRASGASV